MAIEGLRLIRLGDLLTEENGEVIFDDHVASFSCPLNDDVEYFLKNTAIKNQKMDISRTTLIYKDVGTFSALVGYFSLAVHVLALRKDISRSLRRKITGFSNDDKSNVPVFLIGQLGKNFHNGHNRLISGRELFDLAMHDILYANKLVGSRAVMVECKDDENLKKFYGEQLGFRLIDKSETTGLLRFLTTINKFK